MEELSYISLFGSTFLAATLIPFASEAIVAGMLLAGFDPFTVVLVATAGNWLGGLTNYLLGWIFDLEKIERRFGLKAEKLERFGLRIRKYGSFSALLAWVPLIGDPLMLALGFFKVNVVGVVLFSLIGKLGRYAVLAWVVG